MTAWPKYGFALLNFKDNSMSTPVNVTACDNELIVIASQFAFSSEVFHLKSGNNDPVSYSVDLASILPSGTYDLTMIGVNWGGPFNYALTVAGSSYGNSGSAPPGINWSQTISISV
jgi:hypothetical protein